MSCIVLLRTSIVRQLTEDGSHAIPAHLPHKLQDVDFSSVIRPKLLAGKQASIADLEEPNLRPKIRGRIKILTPEVPTFCLAVCSLT